MNTRAAEMMGRVCDQLTRAGLEPEQGSNGIRAGCPVCKRRSLLLRSDEHGAVVKCRSDCAEVAILKALGLRMEDVRTPMNGADGPARSSAPEIPGTSRAAPAPDVPAREKELANVVCVADVKRERVEWLWQNRIPFGKLTVIDGDPGQGKSTLTLDIAARVSTGRPLPGCAEPCSAMGVVLVSLEDGVGELPALGLVELCAQFLRGAAEGDERPGAGIDAFGRGNTLESGPTAPGHAYPAGGRAG